MVLQKTERMCVSLFSFKVTVAYLADVKFVSAPPEVNYIIIPTQVPYWYSFLVMMKLSLSVTIWQLIGNLEISEGSPWLTFCCLFNPYSLTFSNSAPDSRLHVYNYYSLLFSGIRFISYILPCNPQNKER